MFPKIFKPFFIKKRELVRIGPKEDGGYIVHKKVLKLSNLLITCGLNDDWRFEKDFLNKNPKCIVAAYDHTVNLNFWIFYSLKSFYHLLIFKKLRLRKIFDFLKFVKYIFFFSHPNRHFVKKISQKDNAKEISILSIMQKYQMYKNIILKIDIEGDEYQILNQIKKNQRHINCLVIEFHNVSKKLKILKKFLKENNLLKLIHIHGNNYDLTEQGKAESLEMTFLNKNFVKISKKLSKFSYPIKNLDYPNLKRRNDVHLKFDEK
jgi:hypothetical protein|tara:strand:- start:1285 stop:2073 length:789 start_codon:yes stop_codon:yes gene_type:complete